MVLREAICGGKAWRGAYGVGFVVGGLRQMGLGMLELAANADPEEDWLAGLSCGMSGRMVVGLHAEGWRMRKEELDLLSDGLEEKDISRR